MHVSLHDLALHVHVVVVVLLCLSCVDRHILLFGLPSNGLYSPKKKKGVAIEDSLNGVLAAKSARMKCIAVPEVGMAAEKRSKFSFADAVIDSLAQLDDTIWGILV